METQVRYQRLESFQVSDGFRGRSAAFVQLWWLIQAILFKPLPQICYALRRVILRSFGARIGSGVKIRPGVEITYPWKVDVGDNAWIGDGVTLYSLGPISIGADAVVSQGAYLCAADHDYTDTKFPLRERAVTIEAEVWVAAQAWIGPGVRIGRGSVVGARSVVTEDLPPGMVCVGVPCKPVKPRTMKQP